MGMGTTRSLHDPLPTTRSADPSRHRPRLMQHVGGRLFASTFCETDGDRIAAIYRVMNPEKLRLVQ